MKRFWRTLLSTGALAAAACSAPEAEPGDLTLLPAERIAAVEVPLSISESVALVDSSTACVVDFYETRIVCVRSDGSTVGAFGREGEGPGEFEGSLALMRGPAGTLGAFDARRRLTIFEPSGTILSSVQVPFMFRPMAPFGQTVVGAYDMSGSAPYTLPVAEIDLESGDFVQQRLLPHPSNLGLPMECERGYSRGALGPVGRMAFGTCQSVLVQWHGDDVVTFRDPTYASELPSDTDVETHRERWRLAFGFPPSESQMLVYSENPKWVTAGGRSLIYDDWGGSGWRSSGTGTSFRTSASFPTPPMSGACGCGTGSRATTCWVPHWPCWWIGSRTIRRASRGRGSIGTGSSRRVPTDRPEKQGREPGLDLDCLLP